MARTQGESATGASTASASELTAAWLVCLWNLGEVISAKDIRSRPALITVAHADGFIPGLWPLLSFWFCFFVYTLGLFQECTKFPRCCPVLCGGSLLILMLLLSDRCLQSAAPLKDVL